MQRHHRKLLTVITEALLEHTLVKDLDQLGVHGYTITEARGRGSRGVRDAGWESSANIRLEVICDDARADTLAGHLRERYYSDYAMVVFISDVEVLRPEKF